MRRFLMIAAAISMMTGTSASAADLAARPYTKAPPVIADPLYDWSGFYIGAAVGGAWGHQDIGVDGSGGGQAPVAGSLKGSNVIGGAYVGYNWAFAPRWILGIEADFSGTDLKDTFGAPNLFLNGSPVGSGGITATRDLTSLTTVRGRLGYGITPNALLFVTGGGAWGNAKYSGLNGFRGGCPNCESFDVSKTQSGWVAGAGFDWAPWNNNWIVRAEYLYYSLGGASVIPTFANGTVGLSKYDFGKLEIQSARVGIAYKFGGPVVAKY